MRLFCLHGWALYVVSTLVMVRMGVDCTLLSLATSHAAFSLDLYKKLVSKENVENVFFSPTSISTAMAMLQLGSRGATRKEIDTVMHFDILGDDLHKSFMELNSILYNFKKSYTLKSANKIFGKIGVGFSNYYLSNAQRFYGSTVETFDFANEGENARELINAWVSNVTESKIRDLLPRGILDAGTMMVLVNAIYFKGAWLSPFNIQNTKAMTFHISSDSTTSADFMYQKGSFNYGRNEKKKFDILELPYRGDSVAFYVLLPDEIDGLSEVESSLSVLSLSTSIANMRRTDVQLWMPKFTFSQEFSLRDIFTQLGIENLFDPTKADLSGMNGKRDLYVSDILHKAYVEVNEKGTEAAGATGIIVAKTAFVPPVEFMVNRPFLFMIREKKSGSVLFVGRVVRPAKTSNLPPIGGYRGEPVAPAVAENSSSNLQNSFLILMCLLVYSLSLLQIFP